MKKLLPALITVVALTPSARAQTAFNGGDFGTVGNWSHGLPTSVENPGTVAFNGTMLANPATTYSSYHVTQTAGVISFSGSGNDPILNGGTYEQAGGTWGVASGGRGFRISNGQVTTLTSGKIISGSNGSTAVGINGSAGASLTVNGGSLETYGAGRGIVLTEGSTLTVNQGTVFTDTAVTATNLFGIS